MNAPEPKVAVEAYLLESCDASGVVTLTMNRPQQFNALSVEMMTALQSALDAVAAHPSVGGAVAAGGRASDKMASLVDSIKTLLRDPLVFAERGGDVIPPLIRIAEQAGHQIRDVRLFPPSLETLFISLTGRTIE